jgi:hypothetical protein
LSQAFTLYTTPVIYIWFDKVASKFSRFKVGNEIPLEPEKETVGAD